MHRIDGANPDADKFGTGKDGFTSGTPAPGDGTEVTPDWCDHVQEELIRLLRKAGILPDGTKADLHQLVQALAEVTRIRGATATDGIVDCIVSGLDHTPGSGVATLNPGVAYINGSRVNVSTAVLTDEGDHDSFALTDGDDTYFQMNDEGDRNYVGVTHGAGAPAPAAGYVNVAYLWNSSGTVTETKLLGQSLKLNNVVQAAFSNWSNVRFQESGGSPSLGSRKVAYGNGHLYATNGSDDNVFSVNPVAWDEDSVAAGNWHAIGHDGSTWVVAGATGGLRTSTTEFSWTSRTSNSSNTLYGVHGTGSLWVVVGGGGDISSSTDGTTWTARTSGTANILYDVHHNGSLWCAVGASGTIVTSSDGATWTTRTSGTANDLKGITYGAGVWCAVGDSSTVLTSTDGITWTSRTSAITDDLEGLAYGDRFLAIARSGAMESSDGITWTKALVTHDDGGNGMFSVAWTGDRFVIMGVIQGGAAADDLSVWYSAAG